MRTNLEILLSDWGHWKALQDDGGHGYPTESAFAKERVNGDRGSNFAYTRLVDDDLNRLDRIIKAAHPQDAAILIAHYKWKGPVKVKADRLHISARTYWSYLEAAHRQVSHAMGGKYATGYETKLCAHVERACA